MILRTFLHQPRAALSRRLRRFFLVIAAFHAFVAPVFLWPETGALPIDAVVGARQFAAGVPFYFSPDGKYLAYTIVRGRNHTAEKQASSNIPWFAVAAEVYVRNLQTDHEQDISSGDNNSWGPVWSPDGRELAFFSDRDGTGKAKLWIWNAASQHLRKASDTAAKPGPIQWSQDARTVLFSAFPPVADGLRSRRIDAAGTVSTGAVRVYHWDSSQSLVGGGANPWSLSEYAAELVEVDVAKHETKILRKGQIAAYELSPDGSHVAFTTAKRFEPVGSQQILFDFWILNTTTGESHSIAEDVQLGPNGEGFSWSPKGDRLCLRVNDPNRGGSSYLVTDFSGQRSTTSSLSSDRPGVHGGGIPLWDSSGQSIYFTLDGAVWRGDLVRGRTEMVAEVPGRRIKQIIEGGNHELWADGRNSVVVLTYDDRGKQDGLYSIDLTTGATRKLLERGECYTCTVSEPSLSANQHSGKLAFVAENSGHCPDLWITDRRLSNPRQLTRLNPRLDPQLMGQVRLIEWLSDDGDSLRGALLLPSGYKPGQRYPLVVYVYGGALLSNQLDRFGLAGKGPFNMQILATRGYAVLLPDAPLHSGMPMLDLAKTILPGVNKAIGLGIADPLHLAVVGHSYGGYSALSLIVQTTRFSAAVSISGASDLISLYGEMREDGATYGIGVAEHGQAGMAGTPWDHRDVFIENSPFFYFDRITTPVLIVQGSSDFAVAPFIADQAFVALRRLGKTVIYAKYTGEGHSPADEWSYADQVDLCSRIIHWLDHHLKSPSTR
jgi:dipeptidyl aminopeptidase/acylaminoacyl peptidase